MSSNVETIDCSRGTGNIEWLTSKFTLDGELIGQLGQSVRACIGECFHQTNAEASVDKVTPAAKESYHQASVVDKVAGIHADMCFITPGLPIAGSVTTLDRGVMSKYMSLEVDARVCK